MTLNDPRQPSSWHSANTLLGDHDRMKIGNNTWLERSTLPWNSIYVVLHHTVIITYHGPESVYPDHVTLDSGGWQTVTTKDRMNRLTNVRIHQHNHEWFVTEPRRRVDDTIAWYPSDPDVNPTMEFADGDTYRNVPA